MKFYEKFVNKEMGYSNLVWFKPTIVDRVCYVVLTKSLSNICSVYINSHPGIESSYNSLYRNRPICK